MYQIIDKKCSGKTSRLLLLAKEKNGVVVCKDPAKMKEKAYGYGITGIDFIPYSDLFSGLHDNDNIVIDELANFVATYVDGHVIGFTLTNED